MPNDRVSSDMFRFSVPVEVRFRDLDSLGHVNNAVYLTYLEIGRIAYVAELGLTDPVRPSLLVARIEVDYRRPVLLGEALTVSVRTAEVGRKSFTLAYQVSGPAGLAAEARSVQVWFDPGAGRSVPIPEAARARIEAYEGAGPPGV